MARFAHETIPVLVLPGLWVQPELSCYLSQGHVPVLAVPDIL